MEKVLIITILLLIGVFNLLAIVLLGYMAVKVCIKKENKTQSINNKDCSPVRLIDETLQHKQKEYEDQLLAINDLMNYSADVAYGIKPKE